MTHLPHSEIFYGKNVCYFCLPIVSYHNTKHFKKIIRVNYIKGCKNVGQCGSKLPICPRRKVLLESWLTSLLPTYWTPPFYRISNKSLHKLHNFGSNWTQIAHFFQDIFSAKTDYYFCVPIVFYLTTIFKKKSQRANHQTRLHNSGLCWAWPCPPKENLLEKLTNIALVFYIPSWYIISKKSWASRS